MSALVMGSSGWIGSRLVNRLGAASKAPISSMTTLNELKQWLSFQTADTYINCIGKTSGADSDMECSNVGVVELLLNHSKKTGARVISLGSAAEYGDVQTQEISEDIEPNPVSTYGKQKLEANQMINDFVNKGGSGVATRIFNVLGPEQSSKTALGQILKKMRSMDVGGEVEVENFDVVRDYISIDFVVNVISTLITDGFSGTLNIGSGKPIVFLDLIREIGLLNNVTIVPGNLFEDRIRSVVASTERLTSLGFDRERYSLQELARIATSK